LNPHKSPNVVQWHCTRHILIEFKWFADWSVGIVGINQSTSHLLNNRFARIVG